MAAIRGGACERVNLARFRRAEEPAEDMSGEPAGRNECGRDVDKWPGRSEAGNPECGQVSRILGRRALQPAMAETLFLERPYEVVDGEAEVTDAPGWGVAVNPAFLERPPTR